MSNTDLYGKPLSPAPEFSLSKWQARQAALLYHFASLDYLKGLKKLLDDFVNGVDITLERASQDGRDQVIANPRWGVRDTAANFGSYGFPALRDFQKSTNKDIALRANEFYTFTGYNQCSRLLGELSLAWTTPEEEARFEAGMNTIGHYATSIDATMERSWSDGSLASMWEEHGSKFSRLPKFCVRTDVEAESGRLPVRTGVYVPQDDPYGTLQFGWIGNRDGCLVDCKTFNDLGLQAVQLVGRDQLWRNDPRLLQIAKQPQYLGAFKQLDWFNEPGFLNDATRATAFIAAEGVRTRPCKWYFVELIDGEFEEETESDSTDQQSQGHARLRVQGGDPCPREGWWSTPAKLDSRRHFHQGEPMPRFPSDWGDVIWQWDEQQ